MTEGTSIDMGDGFGGMSLLSGGAAINQNIIAQNYENKIQAQQLAAGVKKRNARGRLRVRTAGVLGLTQADGKRGAWENNQEKPGRGLSVQ